VSSPTSRTLTLLRREGYAADIAERRLPVCFISRDLFGAFDVVGIKADLPGVLGVQTTSASNFATRFAWLLANPTLATWLAAGNKAEVISWRKVKGHWAVRRQPLTPADLGAAG
jgi:hypothetical protein